MKHLHCCIRLLQLVLVARLLGTVGFAQTESAHGPGRWEMGLIAGGLTFQNTYAENESRIVDIRNHYLDLQAYGLRHLENGFFWRGNLGFSGRDDHRSFTSYGWATQTTLQTANVLQLQAGAAFGYQVPRSQKPYLDKLQLRTGLLLHNVTLLHAQDQFDTYVIDSLGGQQHVTGGNRFQESYFSLQAAAFFQVTCDLLKRLRVGLEWRYGPKISANRTQTAFDSQTGNYSDRSFSLNWDLGLPQPIFSIGYTF